MDTWIPYVIGTVAFAYIHMYNRIAGQYHASGRTLTLLQALGADARV
jgi:hypothetical protein